MQDENMIIDTESKKNDSLYSGLENDSRLNIGKEIDIANDLLIKAKFIFGDDDLQYMKILQAKIQLEKLLAIPSPTGYTKDVTNYLVNELQSMGYSPYSLHKGGVICALNEGENAVMLAAHVDTLGAMVKTVKGNGALTVTALGGLNAANVETETAWVLTRDGRKYEGTFQLENASSHVNREVNTAVRSFDSTVELLLDEKVYSARDTKALGIETGDFVAVNPRFTITESGFIKSRFLDDKASAAVLLSLA